VLIHTYSKVIIRPRLDLAIRINRVMLFSLEFRVAVLLNRIVPLIAASSWFCRRPGLRGPSGTGL